MKIQTRIISAVILVIAIATAVFGLYLYTAEREHSLARLRTVMEADERLLAVVIAGPLYDGNVEQLNTTFDSFFSNPDMVRVDLTEHRGNIRISRTRNPAAALGETFRSRIVVKRGIDELGEIVVAYSTARIEQALLALRNQILLFSGTLVLVLAVIISFVVRGLTRPIERFTAAARDMANGRLDREIDTRGAEELQSLGRSFIRMRDAIREKIADLAARNEAFRISEDRLQQAIRASEIAIFDHDQRVDSLYWSPLLRKHYGLGPGEPASLSAFIDLVHPDDRDRITASVRRAHDPAGDGLWDVEHRIVRRDGSVRWLKQRSQTFFEGEGEERRPVRTVGAVLDITERRIADEAQRASEERLRAAVTVAQIGIFDHDQRADTVYWSPQQRDIHGWGPDEPVSLQSFIDLVHPEDRDRITASIHRAHDPGGDGIWDVELRIKRRDGSIRWLKERSQTFFEGEGNARRPVRTIGLALDITERKQAESALQQSFSLLQATLEATADGLLVVEGTNKITGYNQRFAELLNIPRELLAAGDDLPVLQHVTRQVKDPEAFVARVRQLYAQPEEESFDVMELADGRTFERLSRPQRIEGRPVGRVWSFRDITERKRAEEALRQAALIVENSPVMLFRWKAVDGWPVVLVSQNVVHLGYTPQELLDGSVLFASIVHPEDLDRIAHEVRTYTESGADRFQQEYRIVTKDGHVRWVEDRTVVERDDTGRVTHYQGIVVDITERKQADAERERLIGELELRNAELERFTYTVSHDLKSPLITMRGFLGYLEKDALAGNTERMKADITRIADATDKMDRLLRELLELSRIGRVMNPPERVPFGEIAQEAVGLVAGRLKERGIRVEIATGMPAVFGDRVRLVEVVQNLVDNGAKFMGAQPAPHIEIGAREEERNGKPVFFVRDNGIGIEPRYQEKIFGLFDKLDPKSEGTGIGLALVKRIIEVHGGTIWIESEGQGRGAAFCFTLPRAQATTGKGGWA